MKNLRIALLFACLTGLISITAGAQTPVAAPAGLVSSWSLDGNTLDPRSRNNGTLVGDATFAAANVGQGLTLDGAGDYMTIGDPANLKFNGSDFTVEGWFRTTDLPNNGGSCGSRYPILTYAYGYNIEIDLNGHLSFYKYTTVGTSVGVVSSGVVPINQFNHFAAVHTPTEMRIYLNGALVGTQAVADAAVFYNGPPRVGYNPCGIDHYYFKGLIDELGIYNRALTLAEIQSINSAGTAGKFKPIPTTAPGTLVAWYGGDGNPCDLAGGAAASLLNGAKYGVGKVGQAFELDGVNDEIAIADEPSLNFGFGSYSFETWVNADAFGSFNAVAGKGGATGPTYGGFNLMRSNGGQWRAELCSNASCVNALSDAAAATGQWTHLAFVVDRSLNQLRLYVDGQLQSSVPSIFAVGTSDVPGTPLYIGQSWELGRNFDGRIDEPSVYRAALSTAEIQSIYNAGLAGKVKGSPVNAPSGLVGFWPGDANANDFVGGNDGTMSNAVIDAGKVGRGFRMTNTPAVVVPDSAALNQQTFTIELWAKASTFNCPVSGTCAALLVAKSGSTATFGYEIDMRQAGNLNFYINGGTGGAHVPFPVSIADGQFHHIAASYDGATMKFFVDGSLRGQTAIATTVNYEPGSTFEIGSRPFSLGQATTIFPGTLDEVSFYNRALTDAEIAAVYQSGSGGKLKTSAAAGVGDLRALWHAENDFLDFTGANNGTNNGGTFAAGRFGRAFSFSNSYVEIPDSVSLSPTSKLSASAWVRPTANADQTIVSKYTDANPTASYFLGMLANGSAQFVVYGSGGFRGIASNAAVPLNQWSQVTGTFDASTQAMKLYINGVEAPSTLIGSSVSVASINDTTTAVRIGAVAQSSSGLVGFNGRIDEVAIYGNELSSAEVAAVYAGSAHIAAGGDARLRLGGVSTPGATSITPLATSALPAFPVGFGSTGLNFDVSTNAVYSGTPQVCMNVASAAPNPGAFNALRLYHLESGTWTDRTDAAGMNFDARTICTSGLPSLSPFAVLAPAAPTAATVAVSGRVATADGRGISNASVSIMNTRTGETRWTRTGTFGAYKFAELAAGEVYILTVYSKKFVFAEPTRVIGVDSDIADADFVAGETGRATPTVNNAAPRGTLKTEKK